MYLSKGFKIIRKIKVSGWNYCTTAWRLTVAVWLIIVICFHFTVNKRTIESIKNPKNLLIYISFKNNFIYIVKQTVQKLQICFCWSKYIFFITHYFNDKSQKFSIARNLDTGCDSGAHLSRFMALGNVGSEARWLYAASLTPIDVMGAHELRQQTTDQTELPYSGKLFTDKVFQVDNMRCMLPSNNCLLLKS